MKVIQKVVFGALLVLVFFGFVGGIWSLAKFALSILIIAWLVRSCSGNDYVGFDSSNISADVKSMVYFLDSYDYNHPPAYNDHLEKFKDKLKSYSDEELGKLKEFSKLYINYRNSFNEDFRNAFIKYLPGDTFVFSLSPRTNKLKQKLFEYDIKERLEIEDQQIEEFITQFNSELPNLTEEEIIDRQLLVEENDSDIVILMSSIYKSIFNEELTYEY